MKKYILNISHAVPYNLKSEFTTWMHRIIAEIQKDGSYIEHYSLSEMLHSDNAGEDIIILQMHFEAGAELDEIDAIKNSMVSGIHDYFSQKIVAFGSVMQEL